jgi:hypothetical protein
VAYTIVSNELFSVEPTQFNAPGRPYYTTMYPHFPQRLSQIVLILLMSIDLSN